MPRASIISVETNLTCHKHNTLARDGVERSPRSTPLVRRDTSRKREAIRVGGSDSTILVERDIGDGLTEELITVLKLDTPTGVEASPTTQAMKTAL